MLDLEMLNPGDVVRLISGSPYMTVRGFKPVAVPGAKPQPRRQVTVVLWSHRHGFIERDSAGFELMRPSPREGRPEPSAETDDADEA